MKKITISLLLAMTIVRLSAQYCGNSGPSVCTPPGNLGAAGLYPLPDQLSPFINGQLSSATVDFQNFDTLVVGGLTIHVISTTISTITNLPSGLCWQSSSASNSWPTSGTGCIVVQGTPCGNPGQYQLDIEVILNTVELGQVGPISASAGGLYYYVRLNNAGDPVTPVDTNGQSAGTNTFVSYNETPVCSVQGCTLTASATSTSTSCYGLSNGTALAAAASGTMPYSYSWNTGATAAAIAGLLSGTYRVTVTDSTGCTAAALTDVEQPNPVDYMYIASNVSCFGDSDGSIQLLEVMGGTMPYRYLWSNGDTGLLAAHLAAGKYTFTVTDSHGCAGPDSATITHPEALNIAINSSAATNGANGTASAFPSGGTPPYYYNWSNNDTLSSDSSLAAGNYSVTLTDANGCSISDTVTINIAGISQVADQSFSLLVFPNPANDAITLRLQSTNMLQIQINIIDAAGRVAYAEPVAVTGLLEHKIPVSTFAPGIYLIEATANNKSVRQQFVISR